MRNLREENIRTYFDVHEWININRQKTGIESDIRLLDIAKRIIDKYRGLCEDGRIFPVPHYMTRMYGRRAVAKRCSITKHITWHQSRHTAATTVFISNGVPIETVSSMLGPKSIKTTQIYAKITKEKQTAYMVFVQHGKGGYCRTVFYTKQSWQFNLSASCQQVK